MKIEIYLYHPKLFLYFTHYFISSKFEAAEIMAKVLRGVKMDIKTRNLSKKKLYI